MENKDETFLRNVPSLCAIHNFFQKIHKIHMPEIISFRFIKKELSFQKTPCLPYFQSFAISPVCSLSPIGPLTVVLAFRLGRCFCLRQRSPPETRTARNAIPIIKRRIKENVG